MNGLMKSVTENVVFLLEFLAVIVAIFLVAYIAEKLEKKKTGDTQRILTTKKIAVIGCLKYRFLLHRVFTKLTFLSCRL